MPTSTRGNDRGHPLPFHRGVLLDLTHFLESLEHFLHDPTPLVDVGEFATPEQHVDQDLVLVFKKFAGTLDLDLDVVVTGLGSNPDFLDVDLVLLLLGQPSSSGCT